MNTEIKIPYPRPKPTRLQLQTMLLKGESRRDLLAVYLSPPKPPKRCRTLLEWLGKHSNQNPCDNASDLIVLSDNHALATNGSSVVVGDCSDDLAGVLAIDSKALLPSDIDANKLQPFKKHLESVVEDLQGLKVVETFKIANCRPKTLKGKALLGYETKSNMVENYIAFDLNLAKSLFNTLDFIECELSILSKDNGVLDLNNNPVFSAYCVKGSNPLGDFYLGLHGDVPLTRIAKL